MQDVSAWTAKTIHAECGLTLLNTGDEAILSVFYDQLLAIVALECVYNLSEAIFELETRDLEVVAILASMLSQFNLRMFVSFPCKHETMGHHTLPGCSEI